MTSGRGWGENRCMGTPNYAIIHARRIKNGGHARLLERHCRREVPGVERWQTAPERARENVTMGSMKNRERIMTHITELKLWARKPQKNAAYCVEFVITASREIGEMGEYFKAAVEWLQKKAELFFLAAHYDEKTPHVHAYVLPIQLEGQKYRYSTDALLGDRKDLERLQEEFWREVGKKFSLDRGEKTERRSERVRHTGLSTYASQQSRAAVAAERETDQTIRFLLQVPQQEPEKQQEKKRDRSRGRGIEL